MHSGQAMNTFDARVECRATKWALTSLWPGKGEHSSKQAMYFAPWSPREIFVQTSNVSMAGPDGMITRPKWSASEWLTFFDSFPLARQKQFRRIPSCLKRLTGTAKTPLMLLSPDWTLISPLRYLVQNFTIFLKEKWTGIERMLQGGCDTDGKKATTTDPPMMRTALVYPSARPKAQGRDDLMEAWNEEQIKFLSCGISSWLHAVYSKHLNHWEH